MDELESVLADLVKLNESNPKTPGVLKMSKGTYDLLHSQELWDRYALEGEYDATLVGAAARLIGVKIIIDESVRFGIVNAEYKTG